jgi:hypothetical protein
MGKGIVKLGEGQWAVKDGNLLAAKETNGRFKNAEFTVTRGTDATYVGKDGLIKTTPSFYNLLDYSEDFSEWTTTGTANVTPNTSIAPNGTQTASTLNIVDSTYFYKSISTGSGTFTLSCYVKVSSGTNDFKMQSFSGTDGANTSSVFTATTEWQRFEHTVTVSVDSNFYPVFISSPLTGGDFQIWGAQLVEGTEALDYQYTNGKEGIPRIDFTNNPDGHLLLEPESRNLFDYSEDFEPPKWNKSQSELLYGFQSPTGLNTATKITATGADPYVYKSVNVTQNQTYTFSVYCKGEGSSVEKTARVLFWYGLGTAAGATISHEFNLTSGWERVQFQTTPTGSGTLFFRVDIPANSSEVGDVAYIWGAQVEELSYPTSYIPTNGSQVTRDAEIVSRESIDEIDIPQEEGTIYLELEGYEKNTEIFNFDRSTSNSIHVGTDNDGALKVWGYYEPSGTGTVASALLNNNTKKVAIAFKNGSFIVYADGEEELNTSTFVWTPTDSIDRLYFNRGGYIASQGLSKVKALRIYKEAFNTTQLDELTS